MNVVFHIADRGQWEAAIEAGEYRWSTRDAELDRVGFIHCSATPDQVRRVAAAVHRDHGRPLVVLEIDADAVARAGVEIRMEDGGTGERFPHLYGALRPEWVVRTHDAGFGAAGFAWGSGGP